MSAWLAAAWLGAWTASAPVIGPEVTRAPSLRAPEMVVAAAPVAAPSMWLPPQRRGMTRVQATVRPFLGLTGNTFGAVTDARVEHYFRRPFMLGVELAPLAVAFAQQGPGAITNLRVHAAYVADHLAIGFAAGERLRRFGAAGVSLAPTLRLGSLDGLNLSLSYGFSVARNAYTGRPTLGFSNVIGALSVPLAVRLALVLDGGFSLDGWAYGTLGLRQRLVGDGGPGTWLLSGAFGAAWVHDRTKCDYEATVPCPGGSAMSFGPTVMFGVERRF